jgi:hypothetical protein
MRTAIWAVTAGIVMNGCAKGPVCPELGNCGGSPLGVWAQKPTAESAGYCQEAIHKPPLEQYLQGQPTPTARVRLPESTNVDWCYNLVFTTEQMNPIKANYLYWENLVYGNGLFNYRPDGTYQINLGRRGNMVAYYSRTCLSKYGHDADCAKFQETLAAANVGAGEYFDFKCDENKERGGCNCVFLVSEDDSQGGVYKADTATVTHFPTSQNVHFSEASLCVRGDTMELSGKDNSYLWDRPGLRTMELVRVNCEDGKQGPGESGIDCGRGCPNTCPP